jgi:hypothetical protein
MLKILVTIAALVLSINANAEWTQVGRTVEATVFVDTSTIQRSGQMSKMWTLTNFAKPEEIEGRTHRSSKAQFEYDCKAMRSRVMAVFMYALPDGKGTVNHAASGAEPWYPVVPNSISSSVWKIACGK